VAFDDALATRVRNALPGGESVIEKRMFGGIAFLLNGNMCCGVHGDELIVRLDPAHAADALGEPHVRAFDLTGRPMKGWVLIALDGLATDSELQSWVGRGVEFAASLPAKSPPG
jgi:TfoX/Sxy family transcriptional regulator of competence genes